MMEALYSTIGPICPHCEHQHRADEPFYFDEDTTEMECDHCSASFRVEVYHSTSWTTERPSNEGGARG